MTIDGKAVKGSKTTGVINPATGKVFAEVPDCTKAELDQAMNAAAHAFPSWSKDIEVLSQRLTQDNGNILNNAGQEIMGTSMWCAYTASLDLPAEVLQNNPQGRIEIRRKPLGVVAAITPWNYPLMLGMWKIAPALLAGNTIVLKPSPYTPITTLMLGEILRDIVPPGVLNVISGGDELG
jgi:acyl-CoA reductase-like NAD-dependent aldehyde dehydrogenase